MYVLCHTKYVPLDCGLGKGQPFTEREEFQKAVTAFLCINKIK
jgi:hypothetical protein